MDKSKKDTCNLGCRITKRLLGQVLVDGEFVSHHDLEAAIEQQKQTNEQLGEILVRMGVLNPIELKAVLSVQRDLASPKDAVKTASGVRLLLGELLLKAKRITLQQLDLALKEQQQTGEKLGEVLVRRGLLTKNELNAVLAFQQYQSGEAPASERFRLGEILVATNQITREQLEDVLARQKLSRKKIGELLVEAGYVQPHQVEYGLKLQQKLLTAALLAVLSMSSLFDVSEIYSADTSTASSSGKGNCNCYGSGTCNFESNLPESRDSYHKR